MSSRHEFPSRVAGLNVAIGWDNPLMTFFAQVIRYGTVEDDETVLWLGTGVGDITKPEALVEPLAPYFDMTAEIIAQLKKDRLADIDRSPTPHQRDVLAALRRK